jgi:hypothetical protein
LKFIGPFTVFATNSASSTCVVSSFAVHWEIALGPGISDDVEKLQQAVQDATIIAEQLSQIIADAGVLVESKTPRIVQSQPQANNVLPVFAPARK